MSFITYNKTLWLELSWKIEKQTCVSDVLTVAHWSNKSIYKFLVDIGGIPLNAKCAFELLGKEAIILSLWTQQLITLACPLDIA